VTPVLTLLVSLTLVDLGLGDVALVTGFVDGAVADVGKACSGGPGLHCVLWFLSVLLPRRIVVD